MPTEMDYARLAAYIDTEGSIIMRAQQSKRAGRSLQHMCTIIVCNTDRRMIDWCKNVFGGSISLTKPNTSIHRPGPRKLLYVWHYANADILRKCLPYLFIKAEQALVALAFRRTVNQLKHKQRLSEETIRLRESLRKFLADLKHNKRGYFVMDIPKDIEHLFYWRPDEIPDVRNYAN